MGFDFGGTFTKVVSNKLIEISLGDERLVWRSASSLHKLRVLRGEGGGDADYLLAQKSSGMI